MSVIAAGYKLTEVGVVPDDWDVRPLASISEKIMVGIASAATHAYRTKGVPLLRNQNIGANCLDDSDVLFVDGDYEKPFRNKRLRTGDLLTARTGYPGTTCVVPKAYEAAQSFTTLITRPDANQMDSEYLSAYINSAQGQRFFDQSQIGGAQKNVNAGTLRKMAIPVPQLSEQRGIAATLNDVDALLGGLDRLIVKKRDLKRAAMQQLLTGKVRLPGFHGEWKAVEFGDVATIRNTKVIAASMPAGTQCIELESVSHGSGQLLGSIEARGLSSKYSFKKGDVLFGRLRAYLRKYWLASFDGICSTEIWPIIPSDERVSGGFLHLLVQTSEFIDAAGVSYGTHMPRSDWSVLRRFAVMLPPVLEQMAIAMALSQMDAELAALEARRDKTRALKQAMMQALLTGRIRLV